MSAIAKGEGTLESPAITGDLWSVFVTTLNQVEDQLRAGLGAATIAFTAVSALGPGGLATWKSHLEASTKTKLSISISVMTNSVTLIPEEPFATGACKSPPQSAVGNECFTESPPSVSSPKSTTKVPRPLNAFILYRRDWHPKIVAEHPGLRNNEISRIIGKKWQQESRVVKEEYQNKAKEAKIQHAIDHPGYQYKPRKPSEKKKRMTKAKLSALQELTNVNASVKDFIQGPKTSSVPLNAGAPTVEPSTGIMDDPQMNIGRDIEETLQLSLQTWNTVQWANNNAVTQFLLSYDDTDSAPIPNDDAISGHFDDLLNHSTMYDPRTGIDFLNNTAELTRQEQLDSMPDLFSFNDFVDIQDS